MADLYQTERMIFLICALICTSMFILVFAVVYKDTAFTTFDSFALVSTAVFAFFNWFIFFCEVARWHLNGKEG